MASHTLEGFSVYSRLLHQCFEPALVRVGVATCACEVLPVITRGGFRGEVAGRLVAIAARNCHVAPAQPKRSFVVPAQAECGRLEPLQIVAILAAIEMRRGCELASMLIGVAIGATLKLHFEDCVFTSSEMTLRARHCGMLSLQGIRGLGVLLEPEFCRFKAVDSVAGRALTAARPLGELSAVRIGTVAIGTLLERQRLFEISSGVTTHTVHLSVLSKQRKVRLRMVKGAVKSGR
jgi:hypothetical protein